MKPSILFTAAAVVFASPTVLAKSELETLRARVKEQERQINLLEDANAKLRGAEPASRTKAGAAAPKTAAKAAEPTSSDSSVYVVKPGDSVERIAGKIGSTTDQLAKANGLKANSIIHPGDKLKVPASTRVAKTSEKSPSTAAASTAVASSAKNHKVEQGETFFSISKKHGISTSDLIAANPSVKPSALRPGQVISLVNNGSASTTVLASNTKTSSNRPTPAVSNRTPAATPRNIPVSTPSPKPAAAPIAENKPAESKPAPAPAAPAPAPEGKIHPITIDGEISYGEFASKHGTDTARLNALNGLDLTNSTVLAKGSELYVPGQH